MLCSRLLSLPFLFLLGFSGVLCCAVLCFFSVWCFVASAFICGVVLCGVVLYCGALCCAVLCWVVRMFLQVIINAYGVLSGKRRKIPCAILALCLSSAQGHRRCRRRVRAGMVRAPVGLGKAEQYDPHDSGEGYNLLAR